jgi:hypothetical protein
MNRVALSSSCLVWAFQFSAVLAVDSEWQGHGDYTKAITDYEKSVKLAPRESTP